MNFEEIRAAQIFLAHHGFVKGLAFKPRPGHGLLMTLFSRVFLEFALKDLLREVVHPD